MMADGEAIINVSDSRSVSSPLDECSSPLGESPHKLISDCSDLYDLINFHSSATTQISHHDDDDDDQNVQEELHHDDEPEVDEAISPSKTNASISNSESNEIIYKKRSRSSSGSSSSSATDHDSDSGHFSKTNGHPELEIESTSASQPDHDEIFQVTGVPEHDYNDTVIESKIIEEESENEPYEEHKIDEESEHEEVEHEHDEELNEFSQLEAAIEKEELEEEVRPVSDVVVESVVALELHDINPDPIECELSKRESSLEEEQHHELETNPVSDSAVDISHDDVPAEDVVEQTSEVIAEESESSSSEEEEAQDEGCVSDELDGDGSRETENFLPPVIVDVEISQPKLISEDVSILESDLENEIVTTVETTVVRSEEYYDDENKVHAHSSSSSDSESDHGGKYGYLKKKKTLDHIEKSTTTSTSSGAVVTTVVSKKTTAEMKLEHSGTPKSIEFDSGNSTVRSIRDVELAEMESALVGVNFNDLKANFSEHQPRSEEKKSREVIDTGVNIRSLRARSHGDLSKLDHSLAYVDGSDASLVLSRAKSYSDLTNYEEERQREREVIYTGVSVKSLKTCFNSDFKDGEGNKEMVVTGVSIAHIKSSFNATEIESRCNESEGVKIDRNKITRNFSQSYLTSSEANNITNMGDEKLLICRICGKQVFHMESIKAEKSVFHKSCFRCKECSKPLSVDTYCSHEGVLYCRQHFRQLFQPKAKFEEEVIVIPRRRHELIIKENTPQELPPDVVRSADKPDYGLNEIPSLKNVKSRFEERDQTNGHDSSPAVVHVKRSESIATKMARFQSRENSENGHHADDSSSSSEDEDVERDSTIVKESRHKRETSDESSDEVIVTSSEEVVFSGMSQLKNQWESGTPLTKEERAREKQEELAKLRLRICHGKGSLKAKYESACEESLKSPGRQSGDSVDLNNGEIHTSSLKEKFERGKVENELEYEKVEKIQREKEEDLSVFREQGTANDARNLFKQMDATVSKTGTISATPSNGVKRSPSSVNRDLANDRSPNNGEVIRSSDKIDDEFCGSVDLSSRFKFFENYRDVHDGAVEKKRFTMTPPREIMKDETPEREIVRDPNIVRSCDRDEDIIVTDTARKMLNKFRELESQTEEVPAGPKPLKRITPPREFTKDTESPEPEIFRDPNIIRSCDKMEDDFLVEARKAKNLREKFERWEVESEVERENRINVEEDYQPEPEMAKSLTAKFEALRDESSRPSEKPQLKVNRFIDFGDSEYGDLCDICGKRVYSMEKLEVNGHKVHKSCFRCSHCSSILRMDNYTTSEGVLYCTPHFKQLFIAKGNYDEGFGREQHKDRWTKNSRSSTPSSNIQEVYYGNGDNSDD